MDSPPVDVHKSTCACSPSFPATAPCSSLYGWCLNHTAMHAIMVYDHSNQCFHSLCRCPQIRVSAAMGCAREHAPGGRLDDTAFLACAGGWERKCAVGKICTLHVTVSCNCLAVDWIAQLCLLKWMHACAVASHAARGCILHMLCWPADICAPSPSIQACL